MSLKPDMWEMSDFFIFQLAVISLYLVLDIISRKRTNKIFVSIYMSETSALYSFPFTGE